MKLRWGVVVLLTPLLLASTIPATESIDALVRAGNEAFAAGEPTRAVELYERALRFTSQPRLVAFNLATAKYHLARSGDLRALGDAEQAFRCCLRQDDPRRPAALYGLANCLLLRGSTGSLDSRTLRAAIDRYTECLREPGCETELARSARNNQQRARLLLLQAPPPSTDSDNEPANDTTDSTQEQQPREQGKGEKTPGQKTGPDNNPDNKIGKGSPDSSEGKQGRPNPGKGQLPPLLDQKDAAPIARRDASSYLDQAQKRILEDLLQHRRSRARTGTIEQPDW